MPVRALIQHKTPINIILCFNLLLVTSLTHLKKRNSRSEQSCRDSDVLPKLGKLFLSDNSVPKEFGIREILAQIGQLDVVSLVLSSNNF